ncbi:MAG: hypothetical protein FWB85_02970 [Chitinispirillia bacterium]|nr:hypothetical protein [Chitinispirillia bacterium]
MFALSKKVRITMLAAAVAAASIMNSCGGNKTSPAQKAVQGGFQTITTPSNELEDLKRQLEAQMIPAGLGIGESTDEQTARNVSTDNARSALATDMGALVQRLSESYAQNVNSEAKKIWEEGVRQLTNENVRGSNVYKTIAQFNPDNGRYKIYSLVILNPQLFKAAMEQAMASNEEFELRVKKDDMMSKMDANIAEYESKYRR